MKINLNNKTIIKEIIMIKDMDINTKKKYRSHRQRTGQVTHMITNRKIKKKNSKMNLNNKTLIKKIKINI